jgi:hypothetical protein
MATEIDLGGVLDALPAMVWTALTIGHIACQPMLSANKLGLAGPAALGWGRQAAMRPDDQPRVCAFYWHCLVRCRSAQCRSLIGDNYNAP